MLEAQKELCKFIRAGIYWDAACALLAWDKGIDKATIYYWLKTDKSFRSAIKKAMDDNEDDGQGDFRRTCILL